jgi:hypothetical protein
MGGCRAHHNLASRKAMMHIFCFSRYLSDDKRVYTQTSTGSIMGATAEVYTFEPWTRVCGAPHVWRILLGESSRRCDARRGLRETEVVGPLLNERKRENSPVIDDFVGSRPLLVGHLGCPGVRG